MTAPRYRFDVDPMMDTNVGAFPLYQRGNEGDLTACAYRMPAAIPPNPPLGKGGVGSPDAATAESGNAAPRIPPT